MIWRRYTILWAVGLIGLCAAVATINVVVDPYGLLGTPDIAGLNVVKPAATTRTRIVKPVQGERVDPVTLVLGNSRPEMGLDPESTMWRLSRRPVYNAALPGASVYMTMRYGQDILSVERTKLVVWGLDFTDFLIESESLLDQCQWPPDPRDWEERLRVSVSMQPADGWQLQRIKDYGVSILSTQALIDSIATIVSQRRDGSGTRTPLGFNPARDYGPIIKAEGQHVLFAQKNAEVESRLLGTEWALVSGVCESSRDFRSVAEFVRFARKAGVQVVLFINPYHEDYLEAVWKAGLWPLFEDWKRRLLELAIDEGADSLWDFSLLSEYTTEVPPPPGDRRTTLRWFWEPAHYKADLGDRMLGEMLGETADHSAFVGIRLTASSIDRHLEEQRQLAATAFAPSAPGQMVGQRR